MKDEIGRPHELAQVKPNDAARQQTPLEKCQFEFGPFGADQRPLDPGRHEAADGTKHKKRHERQHVALPRNRAALPPEDHQQRGRQRGGDGLCQQSQHEQAQRDEIVASAAATRRS